MSIDLSEKIKKQVMPDYWYWRDELFYNWPIKLVNPDNWHLTLLFFGDRNEGAQKEILSVLDQNVFQKNIVVKFSGLGCFGQIFDPKILFIKARADGLNEYVAELAKKMKNRRIVFDEKSFHVHLTIGRFKGRLSQDQMKILTDLTKRQTEVWGEMPVKKISLYSSRLTGSGSIYQLISEFPVEK